MALHRGAPDSDAVVSPAAALTRTTSPGISLFFLVYNDEGTVETVARKSLALLDSLTDTYEIVIVDDGSPDRAGELADTFALEHPQVRVVHHEVNRGYGAAVRSGLAVCRYEYICFVDGDDEYDVEDFRRILRLRDYYDLIITFRYKKIYSGTRIFISWIYNRLLGLLFRTRFRDVSTGLRMIRRSVAEDLTLLSDSPFIGAEIAIKTMLKGYRVGEVGIQTFPRTFGRSTSTSPRNIIATIGDMRRVYRQVFSDDYDLPPGRARGR
jgi:glycosyltransferase involved in cell wall biosynthesis